MGVLAGVLILSYYAVIAGWVLNYVWLTASGTFDAASAQVATSTFDQLQQDPLQMVAWHSLFIFITIWIVARGVSREIGNGDSMVYAFAVRFAVGVIRVQRKLWWFCPGLGLYVRL